jgi:hypothetical protein
MEGPGQYEAKFDEFRKTLTWEGRAEKIRMPYLCAAGEFDELSPLENTERLLKALQGPKRFVVYQESRHADRRRCLDQSRPVPSGDGRGLDRRALCRRAVCERALVRGVDGADHENAAVR